jgi:hypothetical protein
MQVAAEMVNRQPEAVQLGLDMRTSLRSAPAAAKRLPMTLLTPRCAVSQIA